jgi:hypothetical protein
MKTGAITAYASKEGKLVHVSAVERGLKCGCTCPACGAQVLARKGSKKVHHFAHAEDADCSGAAETVLHILAKEIISELSSMTIPEYRYIRWKRFHEKRMHEDLEMRAEHREQLAAGGEVLLESVQAEPHYGSFKPDIELQMRGKTLFLEIAVTHRVGTRKRRVLRKHGVPAIELRLNQEHALLEPEELKSIIQSDENIKYWLYHPRENKAIHTFFKKYREAQLKRRTVLEAIKKYCPDYDAVWDYVEKFKGEHGRTPYVYEIEKDWNLNWGKIPDELFETFMLVIHGHHLRISRIHQHLTSGKSGVLKI